MKRCCPSIFIAVLAVATIASGCHKKVAATPPAPPAQPAAAVKAPPAPANTPRYNPPAERQVASNPPARYPDAKTRARIDELLAKIEDAYFDYDKHTLRPDAIKALQADSTELRDIIVQYPTYKLTIEGHCDERGSEEYNRALGDARAQAAKDYLTGVGIPSAQLAVISYGKDKPVCDEHDENCWQKNRRIHIVAAASN
jgi:peptidoglycan-associated lipoprotein